MNVTYLPNNTIKITNLTHFSLTKTFDCGQCFRFEVHENQAEGVALGRFLRLIQESPSTLLLYPVTPNDFHSLWKSYLGLDMDYTAIYADLLRNAQEDSFLQKALEYGDGIRILRQEPWETLCSFILSQNNNIPRIKGIIRNLCVTYGQQLDDTQFAFPTAQSLQEAGTDAIFALRTGFRAKYVYDAAEKTVQNEIPYNFILQEATTLQGLDLLQTVKGVGLKVASCTLLFGFQKWDAFPVDVWMKRIFTKYYPNGFDIAKLGQYAGIAQQSLFYYERSLTKG